MTTNNIQTAQEQRRVTNFGPVGNSVLLPCSTTSGNTALAFPTLPVGGIATDIYIYNMSNVEAWIATGNSTVTVGIPASNTPANGIVIPPGDVIVLSKGTATYIAGITASSTANLYVSPGFGS